MRNGRPSQSERSEFGARVCALREAAGLTQEQVARELGISQPSYAMWERKEVALRPEQLTQLARILAVRVEELLETEPRRNRQGGGPVGRARRAFESVSRLPRQQQRKILEVVEALVTRQPERQ